MPIAPEEGERYKQLFEHWRFASKIRFNILAAWWAVYVGLAIVFAWMSQSSLRREAWLVPVIGIIATVLFLAMDERNGRAIRAAQDVLDEIEKAANLPDRQRIVFVQNSLYKNTYGFLGLDVLGRMRHYRVIRLFACVMIVLFIALLVRIS